MEIELLPSISTSIASERYFSIINLTDTDKRNKLLPEKNQQIIDHLLME